MHPSRKRSCCCSFHTAQSRMVTTRWCLRSINIVAVWFLKRRRIRDDLTETFKILSGKENVDSETFFQLADSSRNTRGHSVKLYKRHCRLDARKFFFSQPLTVGIPCRNVIHCVSKNVTPLQLAIIFTQFDCDNFWRKCCQESRQSKFTLFSHHT